MGVFAVGSEGDCTGVFDSIRVAVHAGMQLWRNAQHEHPQKSGGNEHSDTSTRNRAAFHCPRVSDGAPESARVFLKFGGGSTLLSDLRPPIGEPCK